MKIKKSRNGSIDLLKLFFAVSIAALHFSKSHGLDFARGTYILVEGFFIISGYFLMASVCKDTCTNPGASTARFTIKKFGSFALPLFFSALLSFAVSFAAEPCTAKELVKRFSFLLFEIIPLQTTGMTTTPSTGVSWYLSAMMVAVILLYPLAKKFGSSFVCIFCPLSVVLIYGNLSSRFGNLNPILQPVIGSWIPAGILRAVAGMCIGCMIFVLVHRTEKTQPTAAGRAVLSFVALFCLCGTMAIALLYPKHNTDFIAVVMLTVLLTLLFSQKTLLSHALTSPKTKVFGDISLLLYLNHSCWANFTAKKLAAYPLSYKIVLFIGLTVISCLAVNLAVILTKFLWKKIRPTAQKLFIRQAPSCQADGQ